MDRYHQLEKARKRVFTIIEIGTTGDYPSRIYDLLYALVIIVNLVVTIMYTFDEMELRHGPLLLGIESVTVALFAVDYALRIWTAKYLHPGLSQPRAAWKYAVSFTGIIDILSFLPYYLPIFFPAGAAAFRIVRIVRIFRLFRINAYYDSLSVITDVISSKKQQLISSVFIISVLMIASSLCMYSLEHEAQPDVFQNAFSGIWWSVSTLLTVGYGDIYPITTAGKIVSIFITFLGVGMVAIPTGIISAGFVDQYSRIKRMSEYAREEDVQFIKVHLTPQDVWVGKEIKNMGLPRHPKTCRRGYTNPAFGAIINCYQSLNLSQKTRCLHMNEEMRTFGYLCPHCGQTVMAARSVFALAASNAEVACSCGKSALRVTFDGSSYEVHVPCGICGETHTAVCPPERILEGATALSCAQTKQFACFIGDEGTVEKHLRELAILSEKEKQQAEGGEEVFVDNVIMYEILSELKDIAARKDGITCGCGSRRYGIDIRRSAVDLVCRDCGAKLRLPAATDRDLDDLCCHMKLVIPGKA